MKVVFSGYVKKSVALNGHTSEVLKDHIKPSPPHSQQHCAIRHGAKLDPGACVLGGMSPLAAGIHSFKYVHTCPSVS